MSLIPITDRSSIPDDAELWITKKEAFRHQRALIKHWEPASQVWMIKYGTGILAIASGFSGLIINSLFRRKLKITQYARTFTWLCFMGGPTVFTHMLNDEFVSKKIILYEKKCPLCYEMRAAFIQICCGMLVPLTTVPIINIAIAGSVGLRVPNITEVREIGKYFWSVVKPASTHLAVLFTVHSILASAVTYKQFLCMEQVGDVMSQIEKYQRESQSESLQQFERSII